MVDENNITDAEVKNMLMQLPMHPCSKFDEEIERAYVTFATACEALAARSGCEKLLTQSELIQKLKQITKAELEHGS